MSFERKNSSMFNSGVRKTELLKKTEISLEREESLTDHKILKLTFSVENNQNTVYFDKEEKSGSSYLKPNQTSFSQSFSSRKLKPEIKIDTN